MKTTFLPFIILLCFTLRISAGFSQKVKKVNVGVAPFEWSGRSADRTYVDMIYDHVTFLLSKYPKVNVVDRSSWEKIQEERDLLKTEPFILSETIEQGRSAGAEKLVTGKVYLTDVKQKKNGYSVAFSLYLAIVNVENGVVVDNIMVSPRGLEDSDKFIEVTQSLPLLGDQIVNRMIEVMELFDVMATYQIGGLKQDDSFREALNQLDMSLIPFFDYYFDGDSTTYFPDQSTKKMKIFEKRPSKINEVRYQIIKTLPENQVRIRGGEFDGINHGIKLDLMTETKKIDTTPNGDTIEGVELRVWGEMQFEKYEGDFSIFTLDKKNEKDVLTILEERDAQSQIYLINPTPGEYEAKEEEKKFDIAAIESDKIIRISATTEDGIKKNTKFSLVKETTEKFKDLNGVDGSGIRREELTTFKFVEGRGGYQMIEMDTDSEKTVSELIGKLKPGQKVFVLFKLKHY